MALLLIGAILLGIAQGSAQNYRFGVLMCVPEAHHPVAISWVLAGGVAGAVIGPEFSKHTLNLLPTPYSGIFLVCACMYALNALLLILGGPVLTGLSHSATQPKPPLAASTISSSSGSQEQGDGKEQGNGKEQEQPSSSLPRATTPAAAQPARPLRVVFSHPRCLAATLVSVAACECATWRLIATRARTRDALAGKLEPSCSSAVKAYKSTQGR